MAEQGGRPGLYIIAVLVLAVAALFSSGGVADEGSPPADGSPFAASPSRTLPVAVPKLISLAVPWRFKPGDDLRWAAPNFDDSQWSTMQVPRRWPTSGYPQSGQLAWYRLTLSVQLTRPDAQHAVAQLGVRLGKVLSAYQLYAGGYLLGGVGRLPPEQQVNYDRERVFAVPANAIAADGTLVLALRVWGGEGVSVATWGGGPFEGKYLLGDYRRLLRAGLVEQMPGLLVCLLSFSFGCYHLYLFARNRQMASYLWLGLLSLDIGLYGLMLNQWKYLLLWPFVVFSKLEYGLVYLAPALAIQTVWAVLALPVGRLLRLYQLSFAAMALLVVAIPGLQIHHQSLAYWQLWCIPALAVVTWTIIGQAHSGNREARTLLLGGLIFVAASINDLLLDLAQLDTVRLVLYGFVALMISMSISLANRITGKLGQLEEEVAQRTADLNTANRRLTEVARLDPLTKLLNRRGFGEAVKVEIQRAARTDRSFCLVLADLDNFKRFNDRYGHACGDYVLQQVAALFLQRSRDVDSVGRWGGEEFILLLPETDASGGLALARQLRETLAASSYEFGAERLSVTMTCGVASYQAGESLAACLSRADVALYRGKAQGRNQVELATEGDLKPATQ